MTLVTVIKWAPFSLFYRLQPSNLFVCFSTFRVCVSFPPTLSRQRFAQVINKEFEEGSAGSVRGVRVIATWTILARCYGFWGIGSGNPYEMGVDTVTCTTKNKQFLAGQLVFECFPAGSNSKIRLFRNEPRCSSGFVCLSNISHHIRFYFFCLASLIETRSSPFRNWYQLSFAHRLKGSSAPTLFCCSCNDVLPRLVSHSLQSTSLAFFASSPLQLHSGAHSRSSFFRFRFHFHFRPK